MVNEEEINYLHHSSILKCVDLIFKSESEYVEGCFKRNCATYLVFRQL